MKKNDLFIHIVLFYVLAAACFFVYAKNTTYNDQLILLNKELMISLILWFGSGAAFSVLCSIPLGRLPKANNSKTDCAIIEILLVLCTLFGIQILATQETFLKGKFYVVDYSKFNYLFITFGVCAYVSFLMCILILNYAATLIFKKEGLPAKSSKDLTKLTLEALSLTVFAGICGTLFYLYFKIWDKSFANWNDSANNISYIISIAFAIVTLVLLIISAFRKNKYKSFIITSVILTIVGIGSYFGLKYIKQISLPILPLVFTVSGFGALALISLVSYILRPFARFIVSVNNEVINNDNYATKEDFIMLTDALRESNKEKASLNVNDTRSVNTYDDTKIKEEIAKLKEELDELRKRRPISSETIARNNLDKDLSDKARYERELVTTFRKGFMAKLIDADDLIKNFYSNLLNLINNYKKAKVRHAFAKETVHVGREKIAYIKMSPSGKKMYLFYALDKSYLEGKYHLKDMSEKKSYKEVPLRLSVKSERSMKYALELMEILLNQKTVRYVKEKEYVNYTESLKPMTDDELITAGYMKKRVVENTYLIEPVFEENPNKKYFNKEEDEDEQEDELEDKDEE